MLRKSVIENYQENKLSEAHMEITMTYLVCHSKILCIIILLVKLKKFVSDSKEISQENTRQY